LQAVLVAADCNPKWLTKHIPTLASTRQVPVLCLKDNKGASLRLGHVVNVRTALAIGVKVSLLSFLMDSDKLICLESIPETCLQLLIRPEIA
jgi:ribosomal protein L7Ae-like RNA K-turn-binding protein